MENFSKTIENTSYSVSQKFVVDTYLIFTLSLITGFIGGLIGTSSAAAIAPYVLPLFLVELVVLISIYFVKNNSYRFGALAVFTLLTGITTGPLIASTLGMQGGGNIVAMAFFLTAIAFGTLTFFALTTKKDFTVYNKFALIALIVVFVGALIGMFVNIPILHTIISIAVVLLMSFFIISDTQAIFSGKYDSPVIAALGMYINVLNMFIHILSLLKSSSEE